MFLREEHIETDEAGKTLELTLRPPDLHVEIVSPTQSGPANAGRRWPSQPPTAVPAGLADRPGHETVHVYRPGQTPSDGCSPMGLFEGEPFSHPCPAMAAFAHWSFGMADQRKASAAAKRCTSPVPNQWLRRTLSLMDDRRRFDQRPGPGPSFTAALRRGYFDRRGTCSEKGEPSMPGVKFDTHRIRQFRAEVAIWHRTIVEHVRKNKPPYTDLGAGLRAGCVAAPGRQGSLSGTRSRAQSLVGWKDVEVAASSFFPLEPARCTWPTWQSRRSAGRWIVTLTMDYAMNHRYDELSLSCWRKRDRPWAAGITDIQSANRSSRPYDSAYLNMRTA